MANVRHPTSGAIGTYVQEPQKAAQLNDDSDGIPQQHALGTVLYGADNTQWVLGQASATIAADAVCTFNASTFEITAAAGNHTNGSTEMASGDQGWVYLTAGASA